MLLLSFSARFKLRLDVRLVGAEVFDDVDRDVPRCLSVDRHRHLLTKSSLSECQVCCLRTIRLDKLGCSDIDFSVIPLISYCFCPPSVYTLSDVAHSSKSRSGFSTVTPTRFCAGATYSSFRSIPTNLLPRRLYEPSRPRASERVEDDSGRGRVGVTITRLLETIVSTARAVEIADVSPNIQGREYPSHSRYQ